MLLPKKKFQKLYEKAKLVQQSKALISPQIPLEGDILKILDDNQIYQIELEAQNDELQKTILLLEKEKERYIDLYNLIPFGYFILDDAGCIVDVNELGANILGFTKKNLINKSLSRYIVSKYHHLYVDFINHAFTHQSRHEIEVEVFRKNRGTCFVSIEVKKVETLEDKKQNLLIFIKDITEKKLNEPVLHNNRNNLFIAEKNMALNEFTEVIVHELNHPFAVITNYLSGCIRRLKQENYDKEEVITALQKASQQFTRITEIIFRMKNLNFNGKINPEKLNINDLVNETLNILQLEMKSISVNMIFYPLTKSVQFHVDKIHLQQVIINLARNAIEAMRDNDTINPKLIIEANYLSENKVEISLSDNGPGIANEHFQMLFSPYFTTKPYGIGLGLIVAKKLIEAHGGELNVVSDKNGSCFKFTVNNLNP